MNLKAFTFNSFGVNGFVLSNDAGEAIISTLAIRDSFFPATINYETPDPECDLDYVPNKGVEGNIDVAASASLGFGGHNGVVIIKKFAE